MKIRKATKKDLANIMLMYKSCVKGMIENGITQWDKTYPNSKSIKDDIEKSSYYVIENQEIIGGVNIDQQQDPTYLSIDWEDKENNFLVIHRLAIKQEYWSKGIGKKLMQFAENLVIKNQLSSIRLDTYSGNPKAINFYKNLGYKELGYIYLKPNKNEYYCFEKIIK